MKKAGKTFFQAFAGLFVLIFFAVAVQAETLDCTAITSVPYTISTQGVYCLTGHISANLATGNAITVNVNNVIIDLNGYKIGNLQAGPGSDAYGIYAFQRQNITIRNGTIRGFFIAINLEDNPPYTTSQGHIIHDIRADMNRFMGMSVMGRGNIITDNVVVDTGGSTIINYAFGIVSNGPGTLIKDNSIYETKEQADAWSLGIYIYSDSGVIWNNTVENLTFGAGTSCGVYIIDSGDVLIRNNHIANMEKGLYFVGSSTGKYMGTLTSGTNTAYTGGTDAGGNN